MSNNTFQKVLVQALVLGLLPFGIIACSAETAENSENSFTSETPEDYGDLLLTYEETDNQEFEDIRAALEESAFFDDLIIEINDEMIFTEDINVEFASCGEANAYYNPEDSTITMCYELIADYVAIFEEDIETEEDYINEVIDASSFTFFHELGHAMVDQYDLPITGNEEDAVDNFATIVLLDVYGDDYGVLSGMLQFEDDAEVEQESDVEELAFWDEHALSSQRFYNTACLIYGSDPDAFNFIIEEEYLPEDRAERCEEEYEQKSEAWWTLLDPFFK
ncbi:MAG: DUF4344 domain-containing metallopeptidase [Limnothrix sp. RL_2_0]|nr:DUF4344 domain-containing metallopeptidase [Limnothrix sp. RL_2_0]